MSESLSRNTRNDPSNSVTQIYHKLVYKQSCTIQIWNSSENVCGNRSNPCFLPLIQKLQSNLGKKSRGLGGSFGSKAWAISIRQSHHPEIMPDHQDESASGQIIIVHTPRFPWNSRGFPETSATFWRPRSVREVAIIWPELYKFMAWSSFHLPSDKFHHP